VSQSFGRHKPDDNMGTRSRESRNQSEAGEWRREDGKGWREAGRTMFRGLTPETPSSVPLTNVRTTYELNFFLFILSVEDFCVLSV